MDALLNKLGINTTRTIHRFNVPDSIPGEVRSLGMVELTAEDELRVEQRCKGAPDKRAQEMAKQALVEINGKAISVSDGSATNAWNDMHPKVRTLVASAWVKLHLADDSEVEGFFASRTSTLG